MEAVAGGGGRMNSREKGKRGERQWRDELRAHGYAARRGPAVCRVAGFSGCVCESPGLAAFRGQGASSAEREDAMEQAGAMRRSSVADRLPPAQLPAVAGDDGRLKPFSNFSGANVAAGAHWRRAPGTKQNPK